ncbi:MAG: alpha/beta hydrolase, partial [Chthoniobacterales bacterium]|nr:alpha/beta hydrolase [Chthoniobacterales bacterium]
AFLEFFTGDFGCWYRLLEFRWFPERLLYNFQILQNDQIPYECLQQARAILAIPEQKEWFSQWLLSCTPQSSREDGIRNDIVQIRGLPDIPFAEIKNPVLIFRGAKDKLTPAEDAEILARSLPNAVLLSIPQNGFLLPSVGQQSQKIMDSIVKFILEGNFPDLSIFQIEGNSRKVEEK